jgi:hypothetical protein
MSENIDQMRERHKQEIQELRDNCKHESISDCMPYQWAVGHISHCVKICNNCGEEMFTTYRGIRTWDENDKEEWLNPTPKEKLFTCPQREDCCLIKRT